MGKFLTTVELSTMEENHLYEWEKINLYGPDGLQYYRNDLKTAPKILSKRVQGRWSVMVWGAMSYKVRN